MRSLLHKLAVPALLLAITICAKWKLVLPGQYTWLNGPDNAYQVAPWLQAQATQWHEGRFPVWDSNAWAGEPFAAQVQPGTLNPLNWILFALPFDETGHIRVASFQWYWVGIQFLGVLFGYMFCRDLRLSRLASILGGLGYGLGGFVGIIGWPQYMMSGLLLPLVLMFFLRVMRGERPIANAAMSGALLGAMFLSGHHNLPTMCVVAMGGLWIAHLALEGWARWRGSIAAAAIFFVCFALIAAVQMLPAIELGKLSIRWAGAALLWDQPIPYSVHEELSLRPDAIPGIFINESQPIFMGVVALVLAIAGMIARWRDRTTQVIAGLSAGGLLFALGGSSLFHGVLYAIVPGLEKARSAYTAEAIFQVGLIALAAMGVDSFLNVSLRRNIPRVLVAFGLVVAATLAIVVMLHPERGYQYDPLAYAAVTALLLAATLSLWSNARISQRAAGVLMILLLFSEVGMATSYSHEPFRSADRLTALYQNRDIVAFLKQSPEKPRVHVNEEELIYGFGDWHGIPQLGGNQPWLLTHIAQGQSQPRFAQLMATRYYVAREPRFPDQKVVFTGSSGMKIFENSGVAPRVRLVHDAIGIPADDNVLPTTLRGDFERKVFLSGAAPSLENCPGGDARITSDEPTRVAIRTEASCRSMMILADTWYPGWRAYVDGKPAQIWKAYNVVRGVVVEGGTHEVLMVYRPASLYLGAALAALGVILVAVLQFSAGSDARR